MAGRLPYEDPPPVRRKKPFRPFRKLFKLLLAIVFVTLVIAVGLYFLPVSLFQYESRTDLSPNNNLPSSPLNVLVLGVDNAQDSIQRSDTIIIASIDRNNVRLTSVERDILVDIEGHGTNKLNAVYAFNGPEGMMKKLNELFGMNITKYVVVDFTSLVRVVDAIGGVRINITEDEMNHINRNVQLSASIFVPLGYTETKLTEYGDGVLLDGLRTLAYARIRKLDSDFVRMQRQRIVINAILQRLRRTILNPVTDFRFLTAGLSGISTNMSYPELISIGEKALLCEGFRELRLPVNGTFDDNGSNIKVKDFEANAKELWSFIYGT